MVITVTLIYSFGMSSISSCNSCGAAQVFESKFCPECGSSFTEVTQSSNLAESRSKFTSYLLNPANRTGLLLGAGGVLFTAILFVAVNSFGTSVGGVSGNDLAADYVTGYGRNIMQLNGVDVVYDSGEYLTLSEFAQVYLAELESRLGVDATADDVALGLLPGNSLNSSLNQFFADPNAAAVVGIEMEKAAE